MGVLIYSLFGVAVLVGLYVVYRHQVFYHFEEVLKGEMYRSGLLGRWALERLQSRYHFKTIVNLLLQYELDRDGRWEMEQDFCRKHGIELINLQLRPEEVPTEEMIEAFKGIVLEKKNGPFLVHCKQGVMRTGTMMMIYLRHRTGEENKVILNQLNWFGHNMKKPQKKDIVAFMLEYRGDTTKDEGHR